MTPDLDRALTELAAVIDFPPTPDLAGAVERRLAQPAAARAWWPRLRWRTVLLAAALVLLLAAVAGATVARFWNDVPGVVIRRVSVAPQIPAGVGLDLGTQVSAAQAAAQAGFPVPLPADARLGAPDAFYVTLDTAGKRVSVVWRPRLGFPPLLRSDIGAVLTVLPGGTVSGPSAEKLLGMNTDIQRVKVGDGAAYWISGAPHTVMWTDASGNIVPEDLRLAGNVLLWQQGGRVLRLEAQVDRATALAIARSVP
jgi:hypothetical protein